MLRSARMTPTVSAYAYLWGQHDYNVNPFAPLGCKVQAHVTPSTRETWAAHTTDGYYIGNAWESYRCHSIYISDTRSVRICETIFFKHKYITMPSFTPADALIRAADNLTTAINGAMPKNSATGDAVEQLLEIFKIQAKTATNRIDQQRQRQQDAHTQRVRNETSVVDLEHETEEPHAPTPQRVATETTPPTVEFTEIHEHGPTIPTITQDDDTFNPPAHNTRRHHMRRTLTQDVALHISEVGMNTQIIAGQQHPLQFPYERVAAVLDDETGNLLEYRHLLKNPKHRDVWSKSFGTEIRRLITTSQTIFAIKKSNIPNDRQGDITYGRICCNYRSEKKDPYRTLITMGGNLINYPGDCGTPTADILTLKTFFNSIISTLRLKFMTINIKDFYLMTPMARYEYFQMKLELIPQDVIDEYNLQDKVESDGNVYWEVRRGMYGLPQAGILAQKLLEERLRTAGYVQSKITPGYWKHDWRPISFTLVVDNFGVKYVDPTHVHHLIKTLKTNYEIDEDWEGTRYLGLAIDWDYTKREVHLTMPGYIDKALAQFNHEAPKKPQNQPHEHTIPTFGAKVQYAKEEDTKRE